ncbi:MAG: Holliday junction resolvase RuvX [Patescibacteria group bacterium]|jgi:putative Holliday junction resolvase
MRVLSIDLGRKRIGVALGDTENYVVVGLPTLTNNKDLLDKLKEIIVRENIQKLIIGWPKTMSGQNGEQTNYTQQWGDRIKRILHIDVEYIDERLSSKMARDSLESLGGSLKKEDIDQAAAVLILQGYLDRPKNSI